MPIGFRRNGALAAAVVGLALVAAACGSTDDDDADGTTAPAASDAPAATTPPAAPAATAGRGHGRRGHRRPSESTAPADDTATTAAPDDAGSGEPVTLRLGYFPNVTHAPAIIGVDDGLFQDALGSNVTLDLSTFNSGTEVIEALFSDAIDASFIGPNPAINGYAKSDGDALRIVAGTTSGGASLIVREGIDDPAQLAGLKLATPSLGNTQDVALRAWLKDAGLRDRHQRRRRRVDHSRRRTPTR